MSYAYNSKKTSAMPAGAPSEVCSEARSSEGIHVCSPEDIHTETLSGAQSKIFFSKKSLLLYAVTGSCVSSRHDSDLYTATGETAGAQTGLQQERDEITGKGNVAGAQTSLQSFKQTDSGYRVTSRTQSNASLPALPADAPWLSLYQKTEAALRNGVTCVQLREKHLKGERLLAEARTFCALCHAYGVPFIVNDDVETALACGADGVHVGQDDTPVSEVRRRAGNRLIIGATAHNLAEARAAELDGADYLGLGAVFPTATKQNTVPLSLGTLREICATVHIPAVAISGITLDNMEQLAGSGIDGIAVVSAIFSAQDAGAATAALRKKAQDIFLPQYA